MRAVRFCFLLALVLCAGLQSVAAAQTVTVPERANIGILPVRIIVVNIPETNTPFTKTKLSEATQAIRRLNTVVRQSSYGKAQLLATTTGIHTLKSGICDYPAYGEQANYLITEAVRASDALVPIPDYSYVVVVHPIPSCSGGQGWTLEGIGSFQSYDVNGRVLHLRSLRMFDLADHYLYHEFGHSLGYRPGVGIGHPDYMRCPLVDRGGIRQVGFGTCTRFFQVVGSPFSPMSNLYVKSDYSVVEKETAEWLVKRDFKMATSGEFFLSPVEQKGADLKGLKIKIPDTNYIAYVSFREPYEYTYPNTPPGKPNGITINIKDGGNDSFLVVDSLNTDAPLRIGAVYKLGKGPYISVRDIINNRARILVSPKPLATSTPPLFSGAITGSPIYAPVGSPVTISGTASVATGTVIVGMVGSAYYGPHDMAALTWLKDNSPYTVLFKTVSISGGKWSAIFDSLAPGSYVVPLYDSNAIQVDSGLVLVSDKG